MQRFGRLGFLGIALSVGQAQAAVTASGELQTDAPSYGSPLNSQASPAVAFNGGRAVAVWWAPVTSSTFAEYARRFGGDDLTPLDASPVLLGMQQDGVGEADIACTTDRCLAVWPSNGQILGRRIDLSDGSLLDAAPIIISSAAGTRDRPRVAVVADTFYVVWNDGRSSGSYIMGSSVSAEGVVGNPSGTLIAQGLNFRSEVAIADNGSGLLAVWTDYRDVSTSGRIYGARLSSAGAVMDVNGFPITPSGQTHSTPKLAWDGTAYRIASMLKGSTSSLALASVDDLAQVAPDAKTFADANSGTHAIACGGGQCAVSWTKANATTSDQMLARLSSSGTELGRVVLGTSAHFAYPPDVTFDGARFVTLFDQADSAVISTPQYNAHVFARAVGLDGTLANSKPLLSTVANAQTMPSIAYNGSVYLLVWADTRLDGSADIWGARFAPNGAILDPNGIQIAAAAGVQKDPFVASNGTDFLVAWTDKRGGSSFDILAARVAADGTVRDPSPLMLTTAAGDQVQPRIASDGTDYLVIWSQFNPGDIVGARVTASGQLPDTFGIAIADGAANQVNPYLIWTGSQYALTWYENSYIAFSRLTVAGARVDVPAVQVISQSTAAVKPVMATTPAGYLIMWVDVVNNLQTITLSGGAPGTKQTLAAAAKSPPVLLNDGSGRYLAAWAGSNVVKFREVDALGAPVGTEATLVTAQDTTALTPFGVSAGAGHFGVAYSRLEPDRPYLSVRVAWKLVSDASAESCDDDLNCAQGSCVDGVCCDTPCGGNVTTDCQACSVAAGAALDGVCGPIITNQVCRSAANSCDVAERCNGNATACPSEAFAPSGTPCPDGVCADGACTPGGGGIAGTSAGGAAGASAGGTGDIGAEGGGQPGTGGSGGPSGTSGSASSDAGNASVDTGGSAAATNGGSGGRSNPPRGGTESFEGDRGGDPGSLASDESDGESGCSCRTGTRHSSWSPLVFAAVLGVLVRARRRR
jgi:MYXO-CTERM domain-containing protein